MSENQYTEQNISKLLQRAKAAPELSDLSKERIWRALKEKQRKQATRRTITRVVLSLAALVLALVGLQWMLSVEDKPQRRLLEADTAKYTLKDGSVLILHQGSYLEEAPRSLTLQRGAALIDAKPGASPLVIHTPNGAVSLEEGRFLLDLRKEETQVIAIKGGLSVGKERLKTGEAASVSPKGVTRQPMPRVSALAYWAKPWLAEEVLSLMQAPDLMISQRPERPETAKPLPLREFIVDVFIEGQMARVAIDQTFFNDDSLTREAKYTFPLPSNAAISRLAMYVDGNLMEAGIVEKRRGRDIYESIVHQQRDPALLEQLQGNLFQTRIFPLFARQEKRILLSYTQPLQQVFDGYQVVVPIPNRKAPSDKVVYQVRIKGGASLNISSPSHAIWIEADGEDALVTFEANQYLLQRDFLLQVQGVNEASSTMLAKTERGAYWMGSWLPVLPNHEVMEQRHWVFLHDVSASRSVLLRSAQAYLIERFLAEVSPEDAFSVIAFDSKARSFMESPTLVKDRDAAALSKFLRGQPGVGVTNLLAAVELGLTRTSHTKLVYLGDGELGLDADERVKELLEATRGKASWVTIAVGDPHNANTLQALSDASDGVFTSINPTEDLTWRIFDLVATLNTTRVTRATVKLFAQNNQQIEAPVYLSSSALHAGEAITVVAKTNQTPAFALVEGFIGDAPWSQKVLLGAPIQEAGYLPRLWAQSRIQALRKEGSAKNEEEITRLGMEHFLVSPFTSLLVLENDAMYQQYKINRGSEKDWARYAAPKKIAVKSEPIQTIKSKDSWYPKRQGYQPSLTLHEGKEDDAERPALNTITAGLIDEEGEGLEKFWRGKSGRYRGAQLTLDGQLAQGNEERFGGGFFLAREGFDGASLAVDVLTLNGKLGGDFANNSFADEIDNDLDGILLPSGRLDLWMSGEDQANTRFEATLGAATEEAALRNFADATTEARPDMPALPMGMNSGLFDLKSAGARHAELPNLERRDAWEASAMDEGWISPLDVMDPLQYASGLFELNFDVYHQALSGKEGSLDKGAKALLKRARATQAMQYIREDGVSISVNPNGSFVLSRVLPSMLSEEVIFNGRTLYHLYRELGILTRRDARKMAPIARWEYAPFVVPSPEALSARFTVTLREEGVIEVRDEDKLIAEMVFNEQAQLISLRRFWGKTVWQELSFSYEEGALRMTSGEESVRYQVAAVEPIEVSADEEYWSTFELPARPDSYWFDRRSRASKEEMPYYTRQLLLTYWSQPNMIGNNFSWLEQLQREGDLSSGDLLFGSVQSVERFAVESSVTQYINARYFDATYKYLSFAEKNGGSLLGMLAMYRGIIQRNLSIDLASDYNDKTLSLIEGFLLEYPNSPLRFGLLAHFSGAAHEEFIPRLASLWETQAHQAYAAEFALLQEIQLLGRCSVESDCYQEFLLQLELLLNEFMVRGKVPTLTAEIRSHAEKTQEGAAKLSVLWSRWQEEALAAKDPALLFGLIEQCSASFLPGIVKEIKARPEMTSATRWGAIMRLASREQRSLALELLAIEEASGSIPALYWSYMMGMDAADPSKDNVEQMTSYLERWLAAVDGTLSVKSERRFYLQLFSLYLRAEKKDEALLRKAADAANQARGVGLDNSLDVVLYQMLKDTNKEEALRYLYSTIERSPMNAAVYGAVYQQLSRDNLLPEAAIVLGDAARVEETNPEWLVKQSQLWCQLKKKTEAIQALDQVLEKDWQERFQHFVRQANETKTQLEQGTTLCE